MTTSLRIFLLMGSCHLVIKDISRNYINIIISALILADEPPPRPPGPPLSVSRFRRNKNWRTMQNLKQRQNAGIGVSLLSKRQGLAAGTKQLENSNADSTNVITR